MEFGQLMIDILVNVSCKFEMYIFKISKVINENVCIAFLYVLSIYQQSYRSKAGNNFRYVSIEGQSHFLPSAQGHLHMKIKTCFSQKPLCQFNQILHVSF